uniref:non-specific serine/threonine protein kinase n=1 Tax=Mucochytrium quahogii TaxID=96639 RepID=A0A7S2RHP3_9STRA|mmetsp:Transcript_19919/g.32782  ORF Transcript_19919/g.32782 Transcript_19919/m.32782 type:complete len:496 (-) Transcript_19919:1436-2923(-)|eukprot:CAMPEP_0203759844 /NCGR_PEP_ID=MMETSP0098-20131031/13106_1 /ASSEMBLY_ACC=CAM_ASM_000208 /TAXON_ID=96639 /ORGANISM=" , Strain NY0313808BC1" /LENGTH=495 /DNA_ID=CAMNT_0050653101 /DNA_START=241 /DNA_END=1728 /DNA_ORIENTATION=-
MPKKVGKYEIHKTLGEGTFGKVKGALNSETQEWVAIKVLDKEKIQKQNMGSQVKKEISIMKLVRHPHVVQLKEVLASRTKIFIVLELVTGGELFDKIVAEGRFKEKTARFYFQQLCVGTEYCHRKGVCHRDLKPENLLLDDQGNLKISDFGLSALYEQDADTDRQALLHTTCGTPNYVAPEVLADQGYDGALSDTWSIGVILYVFLAGFLPFDEPTMAALFRKIQKADFSYPSWFTDEVKDLLGKILIVDPSKRWNIKQIMDHSWWKKDGPYALCSDIDSTGFSTLPNNSSGSIPVPATPPAEPSSTEAVVADKMDVSGDEGATAEANNVVKDIHEEADTLPKTASQLAEAEQFPKRVNAFDLINMCSGTAINRMLQSGDEKNARKTLIYASSKPAKDIMAIIVEKFKSIEGFLEQRAYKNDSKLRAVFDLGHGHVHVKVAIKLASTNPNLCLIVFKRARGDLISFNKISEALASIATAVQSEGGAADKMTGVTN